MKYRQTLKRQATRLAVLALLVCLASNGKLSLGDEPSPAFDFHKGALANGLKIVTVEDFSCPIVAVHLWYHVGSKNESPDRQGFAHMFEHMMFRGTDHLGPTDHFDFIHRVGGSCNAYTTFDQTVYVQTVPANQVELALWLEAERMSMLKIDQNSFDTERKVVEEERRMGLNRPYGTLMERVLPVLTPGHPYRWTPIGSIPHLRAASVAELRQFWTRYYVPNNATLVLVGAIHHERAEQLARKYFGWIPRYDAPPRVTPPDNKPFQRQQVTLKERNAPAPVVALLFRGIPLASDDDAALELMTTILGGGQSSRLYRRIVAQDQSAVFALAGAMSLEQSGVVGAGAVLKPIGGDPDKVLQALESEIQRIRREPVRDAELLKARNQLLKQLVQENLTVEGKARAVGTAAVLEGDVSRVTTRIDRIRKVTTADIQRVAKTYLDPDHAVTMRVERNLLGTLGSLLGMKASVEDAPITAKREEHAPPPGRPGAARPADYPSHPAVAKRLDFDTTVDIQSQTLANGLTVVVVENHEIPYVSATLGLLAGAWTESKPGTASMALQMLTKGTDRHSEEELARELETYAISLSGEASMDNSTVSMSCLPDQVGEPSD